MLDPHRVNELGRSHWVGRTPDRASAESSATDAAAERQRIAPPAGHLGRISTLTVGRTSEDGRPVSSTAIRGEGSRFARTSAAGASATSTVPGIRRSTAKSR